MRVLLVIDGMHPRDGGPPAVVAGSAEALQARGVQVSVVTTARPGDENAVRSTWRAVPDAGVELHLIPALNPLSLLVTRHPSGELRALIDQADVVHLHSVWSPMAVLTANYAKKIGRPYFVSTHGVLDHRAMWRTRLKWMKKRVVVELTGLRVILRDAAGVIFGSEAEALESWDLAPGMNRLFIPNGVAADVRRFPVSSEARDLVDQIAPQFAGWKRSLLYFSRIHPEKGLDMLVTAFNAVAGEFPDAGLFIAGIRQDENFLSHVKRLIEHGGHKDRIVLTTELTGPRSRFVHSLCDIFVLPSHAEGFSVAMIEALAHGMPCLITQYCHAPLVESEGAGVVVSPNVEGIEAGLRKLLSLTADELAFVGGKARTLFEASYTWDRVAEELEIAYSSARTASVAGSACVI